MPPPDPESAHVSPTLEKRHSQPRRLGVLLLASLAAAAVVVVALGAALSGQWAVRRSVLVAATPERVHRDVGDLQRWPRWAFWGRQPPHFRFWFEGTQGTGQTLHWQETREGTELGAGSISLTESTPAEGVAFQTRMPKGKTGSGSIRYERVGDMTRVIWQDEGELPPIVGGLFLDLFQKRLGRHMETGLAQLKQLSEAAPEGP